MFAICTVALSQERNATASNGCARGRAVAKITNKGVYGYIEVTNDCDGNRYLPSSKGEVEVLSERENKDGKIIKTWRKSSLTTGNLFLSGGSSVTVERAADDSDWVGYFTNLRNLQLEINAPREPRPGKPNDRAIPIQLGESMKIYEADGMEYFLRISKTSTSNGLWSYSGVLTVVNNTGGKVKYSDVVKYKLWYEGFAWTLEAKFKTVRNDDSDYFSAPAKFNYNPEMYFELLDIPSFN